MKINYLKVLLAITAWCVALPFYAASALQQAEDSHRFAKQLIPNADKVTLLSSSNSHSEISAYCGKPGEGFVIVGGNGDILGYSATGTISHDNLPPMLQQLLKQYQSQAPATRSSQVEASGSLEYRPTPVVASLLKAKWGQNYPYNIYAPNSSPTGCVATAMAQVMYHHRWPVDRPSFNPYGEGTDPATVGSTYRWELMLDSYSGTNTEEARKAVALLMRDAGVGARMKYTYSGSTAAMSTACGSLASDFKYHTQFVNRAAYSTSNLIAMITKELQAGRPILFSGKGNGGHAFVCDGIDSNDMLSMNWGWEGMGDGYYDINLLMPSSIGTGGGGGDYSYTQEIIFLCPNKGDASPYANVTQLMSFGEGSYLHATTAEVSKTSTFQVEAHEVGNATINTGKWNVALAINDQNGNRVGDLQPMKGTDGTMFLYQLGVNTFTNIKLDVNCSNLSDGTYTLVMYANYVGTDNSNTLNWQPVQNPRTLKINVSNGKVVAENPVQGIRLAMASQPQELMRAYNNYHAGVAISIKNLSDVVARGDLEMVFTSVQNQQTYTIPLNQSVVINDGATKDYAFQYAPTTANGQQRLPDGDYTVAFYLVGTRLGAKTGQRYAIENEFGQMTIKLRPRLSGGYLEYQNLDFFKKGEQTPQETFSNMNEEIELKVKVKNISFSTYRNKWTVKLQDTEQNTLYKIGEYSQNFVGEVQASFTFVPQTVGLQAGRLYKVVLEGTFADGETTFWNANMPYRYVMFGNEETTTKGTLTNIAQVEGEESLDISVQQGKLIVRSPFAIEDVTVCDMNGRKVLVAPVAMSDDESTIAMDNLQKGVYLVKVKTAKGNVCRKVIMGW